MSAAWLEPDWPAPAGVRALSTFRSGGVSDGTYASLNLGEHVGDDAAAVADNRRVLGVAADLPGAPHWLKQVHGTGVVDLDAEPQDAALAAGADASYTRRTAQVCAVLAADCLPILFASESGDLVAAAHAGWRGLAGGVIEATIKALGVPPRKLLVWLGPAIGPRHFEVGPEVRTAMLLSDAGAVSAFTVNARGRYMADLPLVARRRVGLAGVERIFGCSECTYTRADRYFSHRRDGTTGRQATLIWREGG